MLRNGLHTIRKIIKNYNQKKFRSRFPFSGYQEDQNETELVDSLSDHDLVELNNLLNWQCFTVDGRGRRFGGAAWAGKRIEAQKIPDRRVLLMHDYFDLKDKHVLEVGCFEGIHTIALSGLAKKVTAVDSRIENVVKTIIRCAFFGFSPTVFKCNIEEKPIKIGLPSLDVIHHVGVLYHLKDPVQHLLDLGEHARVGIMLDTHYAPEDEAKENYEANGIEYRYKKFNESGYSDPFSGMYDHAKWLKLDDIVNTLKCTGFSKVEIIETRNERNGPRVLLFAKKGPRVPPLEGQME